MIELERSGDVAILRLRGGENRFGPALVEALSAHLDALERAPGPLALVTTGEGKFYSNGLDLEWMTGEGRADADGYLASVLGLMARVLTFPAVTVAAVNGHAFGAGGQLALAHDYRVMREERGYFCMPEIDMRASLHPGMTALIQARLSPGAAHECIVTGRRYTAAEALAQSIVDEAVPGDQVLARAVERAGAWAAKAHPVMRTLKRDLHPVAVEALENPRRLAELSPDRGDGR